MRPATELPTDCASQEPFALQVLGTEMEPEFPDRCIILITPNVPYHSGMYVVAEVAGERWFRQYHCANDGRAWLSALNPVFPDIALSGLEWKILGVITQRNVRRQIKQYHYAAQ